MDYKKEGVTFVGQIIVLLIFTFLLKDILAALVVSFLSRPLIKMAWGWFEKTLRNANDKKLALTASLHDPTYYSI